MVTDETEVVGINIEVILNCLDIDVHLVFEVLDLIDDIDQPRQHTHIHFDEIVDLHMLDEIKMFVVLILIVPHEVDDEHDDLDETDTMVHIMLEDIDEADYVDIEVEVVDIEQLLDVDEQLLTDDELEQVEVWMLHEVMQQIVDDDEVEVIVVDEHDVHELL